MDFEKQLANIKIAEKETKSAKEEKESVIQESKVLQRKIDALEKQMVEKDEINKDQWERIAELDDCLCEKNQECQALYNSI